MGQGVEFEDNFQDGAKWPEDKKALASKLLYPNLPYLEDGDVIMNESVAILKYLGRKTGLAPKSEAEHIWADQFEGFMADILYIHLHLHMYIHMYIYTCIYICIYLCIFICISLLC